MLENQLAMLYFYSTAIYNCSGCRSFARINFVDSIQDVEYSAAPDWFKNWENIGLIAWQDKNDDQSIQYSSRNALEGVDLITQIAEVKMESGF